jgi:Universal stress protein family
MRAANRSGVAYRGRAAAEASARRCPLHVDVLVEARLAVAEPAAALIRESEGAALIVVGSRAHGVARATFLRSVSRSVVQRARCPVVVVRTGRATGDEAQPSRRTAVDLVDPSAAKPVRRRRTPWE